jgi:hypothetical protein
MSICPTILRTRRVGHAGHITLYEAGQEPRREVFNDLSLGGLFVETLVPEDPGTRLSVGLNLQGLRLKAPAEVVWARIRSKGPSQPAGMGLAFLDLSRSQRRLFYDQIGLYLKRGAELKLGTPPKDRGTTSPSTEGATGSAKSGLRSIFSRFKKGK